jgi:hypothetical protein
LLIDKASAFDARKGKLIVVDQRIGCIASSDKTSLVVKISQKRVYKSLTLNDLVLADFLLLDLSNRLIAGFDLR